MRSYATEFLGTFFLSLTIALTAGAGAGMAPLAYGLALGGMVYMGRHVSGAHYNPAVSAALLMRGRLTTSRFGGYVVSQCLGAMVAGVVTQLIAGNTAAPMPGADATTAGVLLVEVLFTFALALVVLNATATEKTAGNSFYGLAIGATVLAGGLAGGSISGGAFNPALSLGLGVVHGMITGASMAHIWLCIVGPIVGAALAAIVFGIQEAGEPA